MKGKIKLHVMMLVSITLCNTSSTVLAAGKAIVAAEEASTLQGIIFSSTPLPDGRETVIFPSDTSACESDNLRSKRFEWQGLADPGIADERPLDTVIGTHDISMEKVV